LKCLAISDPVEEEEGGARFFRETESARVRSVMDDAVCFRPFRWGKGKGKPAYLTLTTL
jgi:hypothetical protein